MNEHILLVEDEDALSLMLSDRLQTEGYVVNRARDGNEGLKKATGLPFDLIILDVMMPGRNGFDVCREIRNKGVITPVMILSARAQTAEKVVGLKLDPMEMATIERVAQGSTAEADGFKPGDAIVVLGNRHQDKTKMLMKAVRITVAGKTYDLYPERIKTN